MNRRNFWSVPSTGDYHQDWNIGRVYGREMLAFMASEAACGRSIFPLVVHDMVRARDNRCGNGAVLGFITAISDAAARSAGA